MKLKQLTHKFICEICNRPSKSVFHSVAEVEFRQPNEVAIVVRGQKTFKGQKESNTNILLTAQFVPQVDRNHKPQICRQCRAGALAALASQEAGFFGMADKIRGC